MEHLRAGERLSPASGSPATWLCRRVTSTPRPFNDDHQRTVGHVPVGQSFHITSFILLFQASIVGGRARPSSSPAGHL